MINVYICDDHKLVGEGIELMLAGHDDIQFAGYCASGESLLENLDNNPNLCDVLLLDINLPGINGIETCRIIKEKHSSLKVIALSMLMELSLVKLMLRNGAVGYLIKNAGKAEILSAIRDVNSGKKYLDDELKELLLNDVSDKKERKSYAPLPSLSRRETEVLGFIVQEYTAPEIAAKLFISTGTVETHRRNIMSKLGARNTAGLVRMAIEYRLVN